MAKADSTLISPRRRKPPGRGRAFTLVELLVTLGISGFVLAGVLTANLQLMRSSIRVTQYAEMDTQVRRAFEQMAVDLKAASAFTYNGAADITVTVAKSDGTTSQFTYAWSSTTGIFFRVPGASSSTQTGRVQLMQGISALSFSRLDTSGSAATTDNATKQVKISLTVSRSARGAAKATSTVATTFALRNKPVS